MKRLVAYILFGQGVNKLWEDLVGDDSLSKFIRVVGETTKCECS